MVVANAPVPAKAPHKHAEAIKAWADGAEIEFFSSTFKEWIITREPFWYANLLYRIKPTKPKDKAMEALIVLSPHAGPLLYAAAPDEANCILVFDGTTNKLIKVEVKSPLDALKRLSEALDNNGQGLIKAEIKSPVEALKRLSEALDNNSQGLGSLNEFKRTGEL